MTRRAIGLLILAATCIFALAPAYRGQVEMPVRVHHLLHAVILVGASLSALFLARTRRAPFAARAFWLTLSVVAPVAAMLLMWPSEYSPLEKLPIAHVFEHAGLIVLGFATGYAGQRYAPGVGVAMSFSLWVTAFLAAWGFGVSPPLQIAATVSPAPDAHAAIGDAAAVSNSTRGRTIFAQNCSACHGPRGEGGMGPSLHNERARKNLQQTEQWIENPQPPMPKLYPSPLSPDDVRDVAAYVQTLR